jgi:hypothetical protein
VMLPFAFGRGIPALRAFGGGFAIVATLLSGFGTGGNAPPDLDQA